MRNKNIFECQSIKHFWKHKFKRHTGEDKLPRDLSPLRYPGGKGSLKYFLANTIINNDLVGGVISEPFCGGAGATLSLLETGLINKLYLNDANPVVAAFWHCIYYDTAAFIALIKTTPVTIYQWHRQKDIIDHPEQSSILELGFSGFFMNRCNRSGLLYGRPIGGLDQHGNYKIDCRFNKAGLIERVHMLAKHRKKVVVTNMDVLDHLDSIENELDNAIVFMDPPYVVQGQSIYRDYSFMDDQHQLLAEYIKPKKYRWLITYDDHPLVLRLYAERAKGVVEFSYQMQKAKVGREIFLASSKCRLPMPDVTQLENNGHVAVTKKMAAN